MRHMLIFALAVAVVAARRSYSDNPSSASVRESIYRPGVEYQYRYESQVLTGIRTVSNQQSGVKIQCTVKMQVHRDGSTVLKMQHITVSKVNDDVDHSDDSKILSDDQVTKLTDEQAEKMITQLSKPIKCKFEDGEVRDVKSVPSDKYWSVNIKKGLLSLMQLKLTGRSSQNSDSDSFSDSYRPRNRFQDIVSPYGSSRRQSGRTDKTFKVMESDVNGECETKYFVNSERSSDSLSVSEMKVTKTKDFSNCLQKNSFEQGLFAGMPHYSSEKKLIQPSMVAEYELTGDRHHYLIKKASLKAKYIFSPNGPENGQISTVINQKLRLTSTEQIQSPLTSESFMPERQGLKMDIPHSNYQPENRDRSERSTDSQDEWQYKETIDAKLTQLLSSIYPTIHETSAAQLMQLNLIVRHVPRRQIVDIIKSYKRQDSEESKKKCEILLDLLPTIQTPDVAKALIELIRDGSVSGARAGISLSAMSLTVRPSPDVVKSLLNLYKDGTSLERETPHIRQSILLSVGTICNKMINTMRRKNKPVPEFISTVEEVSIELTNMLEQSISERDTIRVLKAMGNLGSKELIRPLKTIIDNLNQPKIVRQQAIFALRKLTKHTERDQVHPILISIVMSKSESTTLRISAFQVLKKCQPSYSTLQLIGHSLSSEHSSQVKTFIYSSLVQMANTDSHIPELQETQKNARKVLKVIHAIPIGPTDSVSKTARLYSDKMEHGIAGDMWTVKSESTGLPKSIVGSLYKTVFGNRLHLLEGGIEGTGLDSVLRRFAGPSGILKQLMKTNGASWSWRDLLNSQSSSSSRNGDRLRNFLGRKPFEPRLDDDIKGLFYGEILGNEVVYRRFDKESIERTVASVLMRSPELLRKLKEGMDIDKLATLTIVQNSLVLPTPMGIPLSLNVSSSGILKVVGHVKINSMPSISDFLIRRPYLNKKFEIEGRIKPSCSVEVFGYMGVDMRWLRTGTALKGNFMGRLPLKGKITVDPVDSKVTIKYDPPQETTKLFKLKLAPKTFVYHIPKTVEQLPFHVELRPITNAHNVKNVVFDKQHTDHTFGFSCQVKAQWTKCKSSWCPSRPLTGKHELEVTFEPQQGTPREIVLKVQKFTQELYNEDSSSSTRTSSSSDDYEYDWQSRPQQNYRTSSRDMDSSEFEQDFEQVDKDEMISTPRKVQLFMELGYNGYRSSKKIQSKLTWISENNFLKHHVNVQFVGKASGDMTPFKVMVNGAFRCPINVESMSHTVNPGDTVGKLEVSWGVSGFKERSLKCKVWEADSQQWNQELQSEGVDPSTLLDHAGPSKKFRYGVELEFPHMNSFAKKYTTKALDFVKKVMYRHVQVGIPENMPTNKIVVYGQYTKKPTHSMMSMIVKTPRETDLLLDIPVHCPWTRYDRPSLHDQNPSTFNSNRTDFDLDWMDSPQYDEYERHRDFYRSSLNGECKVHRGKMQTFDGTPLLLPIYDSETSSSRCDVLLAQDCSDRGTFSVTGSFKRGRWTIKALVADNVIELTPDNNEDKVTCKVNGEEMRVRSSVPVYVRESQRDQSSPVSCKVEKTDEGLKLKLRDLGVSIELTDNSKIFIKVKPWSMMQGRLCGLCGNHNYDQSDDMTSLDRKLMYSSRHFVLDSVLPSSYCDASDYERQLGSRHESFCRKEKTLKIERSVNGQEQTCFSTQPVTVCRKHCSPQSETERNVRFSCAPRDSNTVDRLRHLLKSGVSDLSSELASLPTTDLNEQIELPTSCSSNN